MATLARARVSLVPPYERSSTATIAHLGVGAFARAHLGVYADDLNRLGWPALIRGVSLMSDRAERQMGPQDGLYTVAEREPDEEVTLRVVGSMTSVRTGAAAVFDAVSAPTTDLVTVTITESGYDIPLGPADLDPPTPSVPEIIARALAQSPAGGQRTAHRRQSRQPPRQRGDPSPTRDGDGGSPGPDPAGLDCRRRSAFPSSVVDRMVPAPTDDDIRDVEARLGLLDLATVTAERYRSWILGAADGLPPFADVGVQVVTDVTPFERRKLWLLNGPHSAFAYCGLLAGCDTIAVRGTEHGGPSFVQEMIDDTLEVAQFPGFPRRRPLRAATRCTGSPIRASVIPACRWAPTGRASCHSDSSPSSTPAWPHRLDTSRFATVVALWIASVGGVEIQRSAAAGRGGPRGSAAPRQPLSTVTCLRWSTWLSGEPTMPHSAGSVVESLRTLARDGMAVSAGTPGDRLPRTIR